MPPYIMLGRVAVHGSLQLLERLRYFLLQFSIWGLGEDYQLILIGSWEKLLLSGFKRVFPKPGLSKFSDFYISQILI
jgi:hypothetical protein